MPRPNLTAQRRTEVLPTLASAFAELGYRRATTAELASRCGLRENVLYRLYPDKKAMFLACVEYLRASSVEDWQKLLARPGAGSPARRLLAHEAEHHGESGLYRLLFAGLSETDDPDIRAALHNLYGTLHAFLADLIREHRAGEGDRDRDQDTLSPEQAAWAAVGLGTVNNLIRELALMPDRDRRAMLAAVGELLMGR